MSCKACRRCHYKCDGRLPRCSRCVRAGRSCEREPPRQFYKASRYGDERAFSSDQTWLPVPTKRVVSFIQIADTDNSTSSPPKPERPSQEERTSSSCSTISALVSRSQPTTEEVHLHRSAGNLACLRLEISPSTLAHADVQLVTRLGRIYLDPPNWPLQDEEEATLLQHFINEVSLFFDFCDTERHFATVVPQRARTCSTLLSAVFALSARHLSRVSNFDQSVADRHYNDCLRTLIPALNDGLSVFDETLLIIVVILRFLEEIDVPIAGADTQGHLLGAQSLARLQEQVGMNSGLRQAAYWACLRQEIYMSLRDRRPIRLDLSLFRKFQAVQPGDTYSSACAATLRCAETLLHMYGHLTTSLHEALLEENYRISQESDQPFFYRAGDDDFPDIRYSTEDQIIATQYLTLARIVLYLNNPSVPQNGTAHDIALPSVRENVRQCVWTMCGIGLSNPTSPAAVLIACMAISLCADCYNKEGDLQRLYRLLEFTEEKRGWPTAAIGKQIKRTLSSDA